MVVIHYTAMRSTVAARDALCNPKTEVSAHYLIAESGEVILLVPEELRAWHAGVGQWGGVTDVNSRSIGIELANPGNCPFAYRQIDALTELLNGIFKRWLIRPERVIAHSDMAPGRKIDPGVRFDWQRLAREGFSVWPEIQSQTEISDFKTAMHRFGYTAVKDDAQLLDSYRRRFRPWAAGPLDATDVAQITNLANRFPVDANATWV